MEERSPFIVWRSRDLRFLPLLIVLVTVLSALVTTLYFVFTVIRVDGDSMAPTLLPDDRVLMTHGYADPAAGDVVWFDGPDGERLIKRVVAVAGDEIEVSGDVVSVNGALSDVAPEAYVNPDSKGRLEFTVPPDTVFVLGDNRPVALDSRHFGPVPLDAVRGKVRGIIFPLVRAGAID